MQIALVYVKRTQQTSFEFPDTADLNDCGFIKYSLISTPGYLYVQIIIAIWY